MEIVLYILSALFILGGLCGCIIPVIPGAPLAYIGMLALHFTEKVQFSTNQLIIFLLITIAIQIADYFLPIWFTKKFGGSKWGIFGSTVGILVGLFFGPVGIIFGPMIGAFAVELLVNRNGEIALKSAIGSFLGFLFNTGFKLIFCIFIIYTCYMAL